MFDNVILGFKSFVKLRNVCTDNFVFRMHYRMTVIMLLVFTLLVTTKQFFGEPIHCMGDGDQNDKDAINSYCWIYGTYTVKSRSVGEEAHNAIYPGVEPNKADNSEQIKHTYYQWVSFVMLGQCIMFFAPRYLWRMWEGGRLKVLAADLNSPVVPEDWSECRRGQLISYLNYTNKLTHNRYALRYAFCEILNFVNVVGQIFLLDIFLGGAFRNYGAAVARFTATPRVPADIADSAEVSPMDQFFPKLTKCYLRSYGRSGSPQTNDLLCVLPLNIVNEKIFVILWFWLIILSIISSLSVLFRVLVLSFPPLRTIMITGQLNYSKKSLTSRIVNRFAYGDWFILYLLGKNMNPTIYKDLIVELSKELEHKTVMV